MPNALLEGKRGAVFGVANDKSIAWACAQACAAQGAQLAFNYPGEGLEKRVRALAETIPGSPVLPCDVRDDAQIEAFFQELKKEWGGLDFVIHSVAYAEREDLQNPFIDTPRDNFNLALEVSAYSLVAVTRAAAPLMNEGGSVVTMTYYGAEKVIPNYNVMGVAKAALEACTRYLAAGLGPSNIRVNAISAGPLRTLSASAIGGMRKMLKANESVTPLRRNIEAREVADAAVYLLSDMSSAVTGEVLHVDAGYHALGMFATEDEG